MTHSESILKSLDLVNLRILKVAAENNPALTAHLEQEVFLSRSQVLRRTDRLVQMGLLNRRDNLPGTTFAFFLTNQVTYDEVDDEILTRSAPTHDPIAREALRIIQQALSELQVRLTEVLRG